MKILELLKEERILGVTLSKDNAGVYFTEMCDEWFYIELNKDKMNMLISELQEIADKMK